MADLGVQGQALLLPASKECLLRVPGQVHHHTPRLVEALAVSPDQVDVCKGSPCRQAGRRCNLKGNESIPLTARRVMAHIAHVGRAGPQKTTNICRTTNVIAVHRCLPLTGGDSAKVQAHLRRHTAPPPAWLRLCPGP